MEASATLALSQIPWVYPTKPHHSRVYPFASPLKRRISQPTHIQCQKMYVPGGSTLFLCVVLSVLCVLVCVCCAECKIIICYGEMMQDMEKASPEAKAAKNLHNFFTYIAVKIVSAQLQSYNREAYEELMEFLSRHSLNDGDMFCASMMRESSRHKSLALRILEVRSAYCKQDFEWDNLKRVAVKMVNESNTRLMREYISETSPVETEI
ncbi:chaperonin-like RBCX protein 1, chloroplastic [Prosopis cineraria]|uniref:chaperonin-like RBCX protein 1, chloroplastic n=1 Tax=Prosopis cineraria TaxID=364024 RepID=UPI00240FDD0D|nr:chaperonin-like RBCX protein 1, chloroplastic [Prosopis cineraria]